MKYYIISNSAEKSEIGHYIQTEGSIDDDGFDLKGPNSRTKIKPSSFPDFLPDLRFKLKKKAVLTDIVSASNIRGKGFLMNAKAKKAFDTVKIMTHHYYPASLISNDLREYDYYWFHMVNNSFDGIDFSKSEFIETDLMGFTSLQIEGLGFLKSEFKKTPIQINGFDDYLSKSKTLKNSNRILASKLVLSDGFNYDLFYFPYIHDDIIASEKFIVDVCKNVTGLSWKEAPFLK